MQDQPFTRVTTSDRFQQPVQVRKVAEDGAKAILVGCLPDADTLLEAVEAA